MKVTVIDMQPITPAVGGGRQRLLGLYHALGPNISCTYVGSYDWRGESYRDTQLTPILREIVVPLSTEHYTAAEQLSKQLNGSTVIDIAFADQAHLSPEYLRAAENHIVDADVVVFSHPWCFPPLAHALHSRQLVVYDSHNVEAVLRGSLFTGVSGSRAVLDRVAEVEYALCERAELVLACSDSDVASFQRVFDLDPAKLRIVPNGTFTDRFPVVNQAEREGLRRKLGLEPRRVDAIFLGSMYGPNADAARFIAQVMAPACPTAEFIVAGGVGAALGGIAVPANVKITGRISDARRDELLRTADVALNPVTAGSGTNIKMFDYMAAGLPILTTRTGARGICVAATAPDGIFVKRLHEFPATLASAAIAAITDSTHGRALQKIARERFSWHAISKELGRLLSTHAESHATEVQSRKRVAMLTTWNVACGIGEHASYLAEALEAVGADVVVLGNDLDGHQAIDIHHDMQLPVSRVWRWDNATWHSSLNRDLLTTTLRLVRPDLLVIQHHTGFAPFSDVEFAVSLAISMGASVIIEMHNARDTPTAQKEALCALGATLISHHPSGLSDVSHEYAQRLRSMPLPIRRSSHRARIVHHQPDDEIIVGGFGFLRPYKGLMEIIEAISIVRAKYPRLRYKGWHAVYSGDASDGYQRSCRQLAQRLGCADAIEIDTTFLQTDQVAEKLASTDIVAMPYNPSSEGASSAVNQALAVGVPVVVSPSAIFKPVAGVVYTAARHDPSAYADAIIAIVADAALAADLSRRAHEWADCHSYRAAAVQLLGYAQSTARARSSAVMRQNSKTAPDYPSRSADCRT